MKDLFGSDDESTEEKGPKKATIDLPKYPKIQTDGKVRNQAENRTTK